MLWSGDHRQQVPSPQHEARGESLTGVEQQGWGDNGVEDVLVSDAGKREHHSQLLLLGDLGEDQVLE